MPEHPTRGPSRRGIAAAILVPAAAVAAIFTASSMATGTTNAASPAQQPTEPLPTEFSPPGTTGPGAPGGTASPTGTGTATRTPTPTRTATPSGTGTGVVPAPGVTEISCVRGTATPTQTGTGGVPGVPSPTGTRTTGPTRTATPGPTRTATGPAPTAPAPGGTAPSVVPGAAQQPETGTPTATRTGEATILRLGDAGGKSNVLVDEDGCALYLNTQDSGGSTAVDQDEESTWDPVPAPGQVDSPGLDQGKVGTFTRPNGEHQVTFGGHQLYRFAGDRAPGEAKGQGVDDQFFLVNQNGEPVR